MPKAGRANAHGSCLIKDRRKKKMEKIRGFHASDSASTMKGQMNMRDPDSLPEQKQEEKKNLLSVTEISDLQELVDSAALAGRNFQVEHENAVVLSRTSRTAVVIDHKDSPPVTSDAITALGERVVGDIMQKVIRIPRRPKWEAGVTTAEQLDTQERMAFLQWRKDLAMLEEEQREKRGLLLTPFEKNLEIWRQLWRVVERSDALVQVVDARDPLFYICEDLNRSALEAQRLATAAKPASSTSTSTTPTAAPAKTVEDRVVMTLLNKADLLSEHQRMMWAKYLKSKGMKFAFFSALNEDPAVKDAPQEPQSKNESDEDDDEEEEEEETQEEKEEEPTKPEAEPAAPSEEPTEETEEEKELKKLARVLTSQELIDLFTSIVTPATTQLVKKDAPAAHVTIGLCGYPNVGKSSTINALCGEKRVAVTSTPGKTKHYQTIPLTPQVTLCDCPGLVFPSFLSSKAEMVCNGVLSIDQTSDWLSPVTLLCQRIPHEVLCKRYGINFTSDSEEAAASMRAEAMPRDTITQTTGAARFLHAIAYWRGYRTGGHGEPDQSKAARMVIKDYISGRLFFGLPPPGATREEYQAWKGAHSIEEQVDPQAILANPEMAASASGSHCKPLAGPEAFNPDSRRARKRMANFHGATGEEYAGTVHTAGKNGTDDYTRTVWKIKLVQPGHRTKTLKPKTKKLTSETTPQ